MIVDPALEELRRYGQTRLAIDDLVEFEPAEPARIDVLAEFGAQARRATLPSVEPVREFVSRLQHGAILDLYRGDGLGLRRNRRM